MSPPGTVTQGQGWMDVNPARAVLSRTLSSALFSHSPALACRGSSYVALVGGGGTWVLRTSGQSKLQEFVIWKLPACIHNQTDGAMPSFSGLIGLDGTQGPWWVIAFHRGCSVLYEYARPLEGLDTEGW